MNTLVAIALGSIIAAPVPKDPPKQTESIEGEWNVIEAIHQGKPRNEDKSVTVTIKGDQFTIHERNRDELATITLDPKASPMAIDIKPDRGADKLIKGIYKIEKDKLTICFNLDGVDRPKEFKSEAGDQTGLIILERAKK